MVNFYKTLQEISNVKPGNSVMTQNMTTIHRALPPCIFHSLYGEKPLNSCLADCPHWHGRQSTTEGQSPERVADLGVWVEAAAKARRNH